MIIKLETDMLENLVLRYEDLVNKTNEIYLEAPRISDETVERASVALKVKKDNSSKIFQGYTRGRKFKNMEKNSTTNT